jgi:hypothetical protein
MIILAPDRVVKISQFSNSSLSVPLNEQIKTSEPFRKELAAYLLAPGEIEI